MSQDLPDELQFLRGPNGRIDGLNAAGYPMARLAVSSPAAVT